VFGRYLSAGRNQSSTFARAAAIVDDGEAPILVTAIRDREARRDAFRGSLAEWRT
jgi:hypothetical protein